MTSVIPVGDEKHEQEQSRVSSQRNIEGGITLTKVLRRFLFRPGQSRFLCTTVYLLSFPSSVDPSVMEELGISNFN